jgi:hypothetical protein
MTTSFSEGPPPSPLDAYVNDLLTNRLITQAEKPHVRILISSFEMLKKTSQEATVTSAGDVSDFTTRKTMLEVEKKATQAGRPDLPKQNLSEHRRQNQLMVKTALTVLILEGRKMGENGLPVARVAELSKLALDYVGLFAEDTLNKFTVASESPPS